MAAKIKLKRVGKKKKPFYRVVIQDESSPTSGRVIDEVGFYDPMSKAEKLQLNEDKIKSWLKKGAMPTEKFRVMLGKAGILPPVSFEGKAKRPPKTKEGQGEAAAPAAAAPAAEKPKAVEKKEEKAEEKAAQA